MLDADILDEARGFGGGFAQLALVLAFVLAFSLLVLGDGGLLCSTALPYSAALLAALALGLHSAGEAVDIGSGLASVGINELLGSQAAAFLIHKAVEGFMLSSFLVMGVSRPTLRDSAILGAIVGLMAMVATPLGFFSLVPSTYILAAGAGADVYLLLKLAPQALTANSRVKLALFFMVGFLAIYAAALLHS